MRLRREERLRSLHRRGREAFIFHVGMIGYAIPMCIAFPLITAVLIPEALGRSIQPGELVSNGFAALIVGPIGGYFFGASMWRRVDRSVGTSRPNAP